MCLDGGKSFNVLLQSGWRKCLALMRAIDELYMERPTRGSRSMRDALEDASFSAERHRIRRLMRKMGIEAIYPTKRTSAPNKVHKVYPYLLWGLEINRPGQVYATDVTYIPMACGFLYLVALIDWYSRICDCISSSTPFGAPIRWPALQYTARLRVQCKEVGLSVYKIVHS